jgi:sugar phosphate isomerase/epimerase
VGKLRIGFCANMAALDPEGVGDGRIDALAKLGYDYAELPLAQMMALDEREFSRRIRARLRDAGLPCEASNNFFPKEYALTGPDANHSRALEYAQRALDRAAEIGVRRVVFGSAGARNMPDGWPERSGFDQLVSFLQRIAPLAGERGIRIVIEPLNRLESNLINRLEECVALAVATGRDEVGVLADYYHMRLGFEPLEHVRMAKGSLGHAHIARPLGRSIPSDGDGEPYDILFREFTGIGYDERVSVEAYATADFEAAALAALAVLRLKTNTRGDLFHGDR